MATRVPPAWVIRPLLAVRNGIARAHRSMVPPEVFPEIMRTISRVTPHAWALDGLRALAVDDANLLGVLPQVGVLAAFAVVLLGLATWRLRAALAG